MYSFFKRLFDIIISLMVLILLSPVFLLVAILVKINLGGPVIFKQPRIGKDGKLFFMYKFRSMTNAKDKDGNYLPDEVRHTKFGKLLRATSLDEFPQFLNVLKGDMSIIGPRPKISKDMIFFNKYYIGDEVRPGITGYSHAYGRNSNSWTHVLNCDNYYVKNIGIKLDVKIFFRTIIEVLRKSNIEKEKYFYYGDELLDKKLISQNEYSEYLLKSREIDARFGLGEEINIHDYQLNRRRDLPVVSEIKEYNKKDVA